MAKAALWNGTDAKARKRGEQTGLETLVVRAGNDGCLVWDSIRNSVPQLTR